MAEEKEKKEKKEGGSKLIFVLVLMQGLTLIALLGLGAFMFLNLKKVKTAVPSVASVANANVPVQPEVQKEKKVVKVKKGEEVICELDPFIVNLMDENGRRYLRVKMNLVLSSKEAEEEVKKKTPEIRDGILMTLSGKRFADIATLEGKMRLRDEIKENIDKILLSGKVLQVHFTEFVIQ